MSESRVTREESSGVCNSRMLAIAFRGQVRGVAHEKSARLAQVMMPKLI